MTSDENAGTPVPAPREGSPGAAGVMGVARQPRNGNRKPLGEKQRAAKAVMSLGLSYAIFREIHAADGGWGKRLAGAVSEDAEGRIEVDVSAARAVVDEYLESRKATIGE